MGFKERLIRFRSFWIFPLLAAFLIWATSEKGSSPLRSLTVPWSMGLLLWSLLEYALHRLAFHARLAPGRLRSFMTASHERHHRSPRDPEKILVHTRFGVTVSAGLFGVLLIFAAPYTAAGVMAGIWSGFLYYEYVHYRAHISLADSPVLRRQRRAHFYHHFSDSRVCFGVTSPLWDYVFRTAR